MEFNLTPHGMYPGALGCVASNIPGIVRIERQHGIVGLVGGTAVYAVPIDSQTRISGPRKYCCGVFRLRTDVMQMWDRRIGL